MKRVGISDWSLAGRGRDPLRIVVDGVLLPLALWGTVSVVLSSYGIDADKLWLASVCLLLSVFYLVVFSWPRAMLSGVFLAAAVWGTACWMKREVIADGALQIAGYAFDTLDNVFNVGTIDVPQMSAQARRDLVDWTLAMAAVPLAGFLGWSVIRARSSFMTLLFSLPLFLPALLADAVPDRLSLMALVFCYCLLLLSSLSARHDPGGGARFTLLCTPFVALLLAALTLLLPDDYEVPSWAGSLREYADAAGTSLMDSVGLNGLFTSEVVETTVRLDRAGPRRFTGRTMFSISGDTPGRVYLRGVSAGGYSGSAWEPLDDEVYAEIGLSEEENLIDGVSPLNLPALTVRDGNFSELRINYGNSMSGCMYAPYQLATSPDEIEGVTFERDSWLSRSFGVMEKNLFYRPDATPEAPKALPENAARAEEIYREFVYANYRDVPADFPETVNRWYQRLNEIIARKPTVLDRLERFMFEREQYYRRSPYGTPLQQADWIAMLLEITNEYDLDTPYAPDGADFVDYFLNESHRGYCVHFASAGALLMRIFGVPARYVEGYTAVAPVFGETAVLDSDAHAWVEIYLDGYGWYPVDMTPPDATGIEPHSALREKLPDETEKPKEEQPKEPTPNRPKPETKPPVTEPKQPEKAKSRSLLWLWIPPLLFIAAVLPVQAAFRRELLERRFNAADRNRAVITAYGYLERLSRWGGVIEPEAVSLARKAKFSQHAVSVEERDDMLSMTEAQRERVWTTLSKWKRPLFWLSGL